MKLSYRLSGIALAASLLTVAGSAQPGQPPAGHWEGKLKIGPQEETITIDLSRNPKGEWIGTFSMPGIAASNMAVDKLAVGATVHFLVPPPLTLTFDGKLAADGKSIDGTFNTGSVKMPSVLKRTGEANVKLPARSTSLSKDFEGTWHGSVPSQGNQVRLGLKLSRAADGSATGVLIIVDQGNREVPITTITQKDRGLEFEIRANSVRYHGNLNNAGSLIAGEWTQGPTVPLNFERGPFPPNSPLTKAFEGAWQAEMSGGSEAGKLTLVLNLTKAADGGAAGTIKDLDAGSKELPVTSIVLKDRNLQFVVMGLGASFSGTMNTAGSEISGTWVIAGTGLPMKYTRPKSK